MPRDARKETASKGKSKAARHSPHTEARKHRHINAQSRMQDRPDNSVSANCLKSRLKRRRAQAYRDLSAAEKGKLHSSPSELGERQYGEACTPEHKRNRRQWKFPVLK